MSLRIMYRCNTRLDEDNLSQESIIITRSQKKGSEQSFNKGPRTLEGNSHAPRTQQRAISFLDDKSSPGLFRTGKTAYTHKHTDTTTARGKHRSGLSPSRLFRISPAAILCRLPERGQRIQERRKKGFSVITFDNTRHSSKAIRRKEVRNVFLFSCPNIVCARRLCIQCIHYTRGAYTRRTLRTNITEKPTDTLLHHVGCSRARTLCASQLTVACSYAFVFGCVAVKQFISACHQIYNEGYPQRRNEHYSNLEFQGITRLYLGRVLYTSSCAARADAMYCNCARQLFNKINAARIIYNTDRYSLGRRNFAVDDKHDVLSSREACIFLEPDGTVTFHSSLQRGAESMRAAKYHSSQLAYKSDIPTPASATRCTFAYMQRHDIIRQRAEFRASDANCIRRNIYYTCSRAKKRTQM
ncbi:unnamed protein product [Trichogramma brassicae]|uniref:Uncharacterized protein n=1 Tax=Trichogramma brassicae TaxID=86971 RepID=A0A6H5J3S5_9HYME|nr:unnamed protein product [Trichogramma brassicae]